MKTATGLAFVLFSAIFLCSFSHGQASIDARALAADPANPNHVLAGTLDGRVYSSEDGGETWSYFTNLGKWNVVSSILIRKDEILIGTWNPFDAEHGALWRWRAGEWDRPYVGFSVRAIASQSDSRNGDFVVIGTLGGVFGSRDEGTTWDRIANIKNVDSVALDGSEIYVGTWHLAYKSRDMGKHWRMIDHGVAGDSDVMSILASDGVVYLSACSGVYKSDDAGQHFRKMRIPSSSRRTHMLAWRNDGRTVYAGTTEGLWETVNSGKSWQRITSKKVVVNDILVTRDGVLLAVDKQGVLSVKWKAIAADR